MKCSELHSQIEKSNDGQISSTVKNINEFLKKLNIDLDGQENYIQNIQLQIEELHKFPKKLILDNNGFDFPKKDLFEFSKNNRFIFFYQSDIYNGDIKIETSQKFTEQINLRMKDIYVHVYCSVKAIKPAFDEEENLIFKIDHQDYKNIYFAIVKIAPQKYSFYYFYDMAGLLSASNILEPFQEKINIIKNDLFKIQHIYDSENIRQSLILKEYQKLISNKNKDIQAVLKERKNIFNILDSLKTSLQSLDTYMLSMTHIKEKLHNLNMFKTYKNDKIDFEQMQKLLENSFSNIAKIDKNQNHINSLTNELKQNKQNYHKIAQEVDALCKKKNFSYKELKPYTKYIPEIIQLKNIEKKIDDLKTIIEQENENIIGKMKLWLNSKKSELALEEKNRTDSIKYIIGEFPKIKEIENKSLDSEKKKVAWQMESLKEEIKSLKKELDEHRLKIKTSIVGIYKYLDEIFFEKEKNETEKKGFYSKCYQKFLQNQQYNELGEGITLQKLMRNIEIIYETGTLQVNELPLELQKLKQTIGDNKVYLNKECKLSKIYDYIILSSYSGIVNHLQMVHKHNSLFRQYIETIQETLVDKIKIIY